MLHYNTVAVFTDEEGLSLKELLEPYSESLKVKPYVDRTKEEVLEEIDRYCEKDKELRTKYENLSDKEKIESWTGYDLFDRDGNPLSTYNPNSKWDWYVVGGRWSNMLKTKDGEEQPHSWYNKEYYIKRYGTKENYARIESQFSTYAVVMPDGEWYEPGTMRWFGISGVSPKSQGEWDENYHKILEEADPNWTITIVDYHI